MKNSKTNQHAVKSPVFSNFLEYWYFVKNFTSEQRIAFFNSLSPSEKRQLEQSYDRGGWQDLFMRNSINEIIDAVKERFGYDMVSVRAKVLSGKSVYIPRVLWDYVVTELEEFDSSYTVFVLGGIKGVVCSANDKVVAVLPIDQEE